MGKGDIKSRRGKLFAKSYGVRRPKKRKNNSSAVTLVAEVTPVVKATTKKARKK